MKKLLALLLVATLLCSMFASCGSKKSEDGAATTAPPSTVTYDLDGAAAYVESLYKEDLVVTAVDYKVVSQVMIGGVTYQIDWSVDTDKVTVGTPANGEVVVDVNEKSPEEVSYKLTATIKAGDGTTKTVTFKLSVPKYEVNSHAEYMAAKKDDKLTIEGIVVAINSKEAGNKYNHLYLADTTVTGGYYCYSVKEDPAKLGIKVGMTVKVTGDMSPYSGMQEIKDGQVAIVDSSIKEVKVLDITEQFAAGADLGAYVGLPVTIKGVTIGTQELDKDTSQYLNFKLNDKTAYVRTYVTDFPTSMKAEDKAGIDKDHADHFGYKADATGILVLFNSAPYLIPMSATPFTNYVEVKVTAADKVAAELEGATLDASLSSDKVIELPATGKYYNDVTLSWTTDDTTGAATIKDGKLTIVVPDKEITVNVTVTATCGDATNSKKLTIKLSKVITPIKDLVEIGSAKEHNKYTEEKYIAGGIIVEIQNTTYGNMVIKDESGASILVYGTYINGKKYGDAEGTKPVVGDYVVVVGVVGKYNTTVQIKNADITSFTAASTLKDAAAAGAAKEHNKYTEEKYLVTGEITKIDNDKYGNLYIKDKEGNTLYIYGVYTQNGTRFDGMATKPAVGDTITVLSVAGKYNDTVQLKNATLVDITVAEVAPADPVIIPEFGADDFSATKPAAFENAIVIEASSCEAGSVVMTATENKAYHIFNKDNTTGAAGHGIYKLIQDGIYHYYVDMGNVNKSIASAYGDEYKIAAVEDCYLRLTFNVAEAGTYTVGSYMRLKNNGDRACQIQFDDQAPLIMHYTLDADISAIQDSTQGSYLTWDGVEVELAAGEHTVTYSIPAADLRTTTSSWHWRTIYVMKKA